MNFILRIEALLVITAENHDTNIWDQTVFEMFFLNDLFPFLPDSSQFHHHTTHHTQHIHLQ